MNEIEVETPETKDKEETPIMEIVEENNFLDEFLGNTSNVEKPGHRRRSSSFMKTGFASLAHNEDDEKELESFFR